LSLIVALFGCLLTALGVAGIAFPDRVLAGVTDRQSESGPYAIATVRLLVGGAFLLAAPGSRAPLYLSVLGGLALVSGISSLLVGARRFEAILDWWRARPAWAVRLWSACVSMFGASLVWAAFPL
jgi:hypothetical protein